MRRTFAARGGQGRLIDVEGHRRGKRVRAAACGAHAPSAKPFAAAGRAASRDPNGRADRPAESGDVRRLELSILRRTHRRHRALNAGSGHGVCAKPAPRANKPRTPLVRGDVHPADVVTRTRARGV